MLVTRPSPARRGILAVGVLLATLAAFAPPRIDPQPRLLAATDGFLQPESVLYDPGQDVLFVSNVNGNPSALDGNGFISRVRPDGTVDRLRWVESGQGGVRLDAPKGMAITDDTLWVADIHALRAFDRRTGRPLAVVDLAPLGATFLNDVAVGRGGAMYVTDSGIAIDSAGVTTHPGTDRIFRVDAAGAHVAAEGPTLATPNGIAADGHGGFVLAPLGGRAVQRWSGSGGPVALAQGPGAYDGVVVLGDGRAFVSSWADGSVYEVRAGRMRRVIRGVASAADIGLDTRRLHLAVPRMNDGRVEIWSLPRGGGR